MYLNKCSEESILQIVNHINKLKDKYYLKNSQIRIEFKGMADNLPIRSNLKVYQGHWKNGNVSNKKIKY